MVAQMATATSAAVSRVALTGYLGARDMAQRGPYLEASQAMLTI